jgi:hypothetical protein
MTGARRGPVAAAGVWGRRRESDEAIEGGCWHAGPVGIVPGGAVQIGFETNSEFKCFKQILNCFKLWSIRKVLSRSQKIEVKYGFEDLREVNNFLYRNFLRFRMDLE